MAGVDPRDGGHLLMSWKFGGRVFGSEVERLRVYARQLRSVQLHPLSSIDASWPESATEDRLAEYRFRPPVNRLPMQTPCWVSLISDEPAGGTDRSNRYRQRSLRRRRCRSPLRRREDGAGEERLRAQPTTPTAEATLTRPECSVLACRATSKLASASSAEAASVIGTDFTDPRCVADAHEPYGTKRGTIFGLLRNFRDSRHHDLPPAAPCGRCGRFCLPSWQPPCRGGRAVLICLPDADSVASGYGDSCSPVTSSIGSTGCRPPRSAQYLRLFTVTLASIPPAMDGRLIEAMNASRAACVRILPVCPPETASETAVSPAKGHLRRLTGRSSWRRTSRLTIGDPVLRAHRWRTPRPTRLSRAIHIRRGGKPTKSNYRMKKLSCPCRTHREPTNVDTAPGSVMRQRPPCSPRRPTRCATNPAEDIWATPAFLLVGMQPDKDTHVSARGSCRRYSPRTPSSLLTPRRTGSPNRRCPPALHPGGELAVFNGIAGSLLD